MAEKLSKQQIADLKAGGEILSMALKQVVLAAKPGMPSAALDEIAERELRLHGARPSFKHYSQGHEKPFPASLCISINNEVVHGDPNADKVIKAGDLIGLDLGCFFKSLYTDMAITIGVGKITGSEQKLLDVTQKALSLGIAQAWAGQRVGDIGQAIQRHVEKNGFSVIKDLVGHGVGHQIHEEPSIPNFGQKNSGPVLEVNTALAIEPMVSMGRPEVLIARDNWTVLTRDGSKSAHFEHTIVVTNSVPIVITRY